jgi:Cu/Ag efflux protein CusF
MRFTSYRLLLSSSLLLVVAGCGDQVATAAVPSPSSAPVAVDLGGSSRIPRIAASAGEGEGYGTVQAVPAARTSMAAMNYEPSASVAKASTPPMDHSAMDHSKMDHGSMPATSTSPAAAPQVAQAAHVQGTGTVNSVDPAGHKVNLNHNAIPAIGWPAMTMDFSVAHSIDLRALKPGTRVSFMMERGSDGMYVIHSITPGGGQ